MLETNYNSIHTGPRIDEAISRALPGGAIDSVLSSKPNPNLLDNWYFGNPVNQRGQTEYTGAGYGIDRWYLFNNITCRITPDGLTLVSNGENSIFECYLDTDLTGITATMTALIDGVVYSGSKTVDQYDFTDTVSFPGGTIRVLYSGGKTVFRLWLSEVAGTTVQLKAVKLELGSQQTLAHQDADGNWVLNEIPDYGEQLARCQRYCFVWDYGGANTACLAVLQAYSTTSAFGIIPTPVTMREKPVISGGNLVAYGEKVGLMSAQLCANGIRIIANVGKAIFSVGQAVGLENGDGNNRVVFSADL